MGLVPKDDLLLCQALMGGGKRVRWDWSWHGSARPWGRASTSVGKIDYFHYFCKITWCCGVSESLWGRSNLSNWNLNLAGITEGTPVNMDVVDFLGTEGASFSSSEEGNMLNVLSTYHLLLFFSCLHCFSTGFRGTHLKVGGWVALNQVGSGEEDSAPTVLICGVLRCFQPGWLGCHWW